MKSRIFLLALLSLVALNVNALTIEITEGTTAASPIAIVPFEWHGTSILPEDIASVVESDLKRSGRFAPIDRKDMLSKPSSSAEVIFKNWRLLNVDHLVVGRIRQTAAEEYVVQVQLVDVLRERQLAGYSYPVKRTSFRRLAHQISDMVYEQLTGEPGAFNTRIAYVTSSGGKQPVFNLYVADVDGYNAQSILRSNEPIMSPAWSPDGRYLAYVSFENKRSQIYAQEILTGKRRKISSYKGINGAPSWSPDSRRLAVTLSYQGNPDIYIYDMSTSRFTKLTDNVAIDTEATWSPDGSHILFTSDRGGKPQLYRMPALGGRAERVTFEGDYNAKGAYSPDGRYIAMVHGRNGRYRIAVLDQETSSIRILTDGYLDESPSFAPNGRMLLYATAGSASGVLSAVSLYGEAQQRLASRDGDVREPAWSPYNR